MASFIVSVMKMLRFGSISSYDLTNTKYFVHTYTQVIVHRCKHAGRMRTFLTRLPERLVL